VVTTGQINLTDSTRVNIIGSTARKRSHALIPNPSSFEFN
jgi:hypothetical protein